MSILSVLRQKMGLYCPWDTLKISPYEIEVKHVIDTIVIACETLSLMTFNSSMFSISTSARLNSHVI